MPKLDEFSLISRLFAPLAANHAGALSLEDDCALFPGPDGQEWAVTADAMVAGVHFLPDDPPDLIARKLLRVNLSDLAAMGATPRFILMTCAFPESVGEDWLNRYADGLAADCAQFSLTLIGGDTVSTPGPLTLSMTAIGILPKGTAILRSNARSGQSIWVSGTIGDGAFGLLAARRGDLDEPHRSDLLGRYRLPRPRVALGQALRGIAAACMDVSDGLAADLGHICRASGVGAEIEAASVPLSGAVRAAIAAGWGEGVETALTGGDDYELLFTSPPEMSGEILQLARRLSLNLTPIGRIVDGDGVRVLGPDGSEMILTRAGYTHFTPGSSR